MEEANHTQTPQNPKDQEILDHKIPVIRTYEHDIAELMAQKKISSASISIAETDARRKEASAVTSDTTQADTLRILPSSQKIIPSTIQYAQVIPPRPVKEKSHSSSGSRIIKSIFKFLISLILIALGIWGGYYLYTISPFSKESATVTPNTTAGNTIIIPSIIAPDRQKVVDISNYDTQEVLAGLSTLQKNNTTGILGIVLEETYTASTTSTVMQVTAPEFIAKIGMNPPSAFTTSLNNEWMLGFDGTTPFVVFTTNFFQNTFAGMLAWEPTMPEDLSSLFGFTINVTGKYEDRILDNKNIREFFNTNGAPIFLYGFIDNQILVIAQNEQTFGDIVNRIEKQTYVR
jgi:hypothetical protein